jgi:nicotinate-nucleotide adenylyltransferase
VRLGILGGTFDPPHVGHLLAALDAVEVLQLDRLVLVPAAAQPLKVGTVRATAAQRLDMVRLLAADQPALTVDPIEIERAGLSYSVDTLAEFATRHADAERFFLVGADTLSSLAQWREPERVLALAQMVVMRRAGDDGAETVSELAAAAWPAGVKRDPAARPPMPLRTRRVDVSSTEVRARVAAGKIIRGFVPDAVAAYSERARLYR